MAILKGFPPSNTISTGGPKQEYVVEIWNRTGLLIGADTPGEKLVLAFILESRLYALKGCIFNQYQRYYRKIVGDLHDHHFHHCMHLAAKISDEVILRT